MKYRVRPTKEQEARAAQWLDEPLPADDSAFEELVRDLEEILTRELEAAE